jgi:glycosyltransferase involved in cell wall biosynthesis
VSTFTIFQDNQQWSSVNGYYDVSIVTRLKNRKEHLVQTLPTWLTKPVREIIIVDCGSKDGDIEEYVRYLDDERIKIVKYHHKDFNRGKAWNKGIKAVTSSWFITLDCDMRLRSNPMDDLMVKLDNDHNYYVPYNDMNDFTHAPNPPALFGICIVHKGQWKSVGGFREDLIGWGWEDIDFYDRLDKYFRVVYTTPYPYEHIWHPDNFRFLNHSEKDLRLTVTNNAVRCWFTNAEKLVKNNKYRALALARSPWMREYDIRKFLDSKELIELASKIGSEKIKKGDYGKSINGVIQGNPTSRK